MVKLAASKLHGENKSYLMSIWSFQNLLYANIWRETKGFVAEEYVWIVETRWFQMLAQADHMYFDLFWNPFTLENSAGKCAFELYCHRYVRCLSLYIAHPSLKPLRSRRIGNFLVVIYFVCYVVIYFNLHNSCITAGWLPNCSPCQKKMFHHMCIWVRHNFLNEYSLPLFTLLSFFSFNIQTSVYNFFLSPAKQTAVTPGLSFMLFFLTILFA